MYKKLYNCHLLCRRKLSQSQFFSTSSFTPNSTSTETSKSNSSKPSKIFSSTQLIEISKNERLQIHSVWLRHHCPCPDCYNYRTHQRIKIPSDLRNTSVIVGSKVEGNQFIISWNDGHISKFPYEFLRKFAPPAEPESTTKNRLNEMQNAWNGKGFNTFSSPKTPLDTAIPFADFMKEGDEAGVSQLLQNILKYGYGIVNECPPDFETTKKVILRVSHPQNTIYGDFSEWTSNLAHADTAYTSDVVHLHTDTTYFTEPIGLQIFHCLKHDGTGGINFLQDGFQIGAKIFQERPDLYDLLARTMIPSQYIDPGKHHFLSHDLTFTHHLFSGRINRIRYNPHDMAILSKLPFSQVGRFYEGLVLLSDLLEESPHTLKLTPGLIIFLDNWRVLHGRSSFTGFRHLSGAYISRSDWLSKARVLGLLESDD